MATRYANEKINVPMAAMIDVVFLLLIFFIVTYEEELIEAHLNVNMPAPNRVLQQNPDPQLLEIHVLPGEYRFMGSVPVSVDRLLSELMTFTRFDADHMVLIKVSKEAQHNELIALLDRCHKVGLTKLNVLTLD